MGTLIDAHGPGHGFRVELDNDRSEVSLYQWAELCEADEDGSVQPRITRVTMAISNCLELSRRDGRAFASQRDRVIAGAINYLFEHGENEHTLVADDDTACDHFGRYWGSLEVPGHLTEPEYLQRLQCERCKALPSHDSDDAPAYPPG